MFCLLSQLPAMKQGVSSLNPYAAAYVPMAKRDGNDKADAPGSPVWYAPSVGLNNQQHRGSPSGPVSPLGSYSSSSQNPRRFVQKQQLVDEEHEMDLEYLRITFPGISYESLNDVYLANCGDLDASIDMLDQLECGTIESVENLPDSLDIGDVPESAISAESSSVKLKNVVGEASTSSAGPAAAESVTVP